MRNARDVVQIIDAQPGITPALQGLQGKLDLSVELAEGDLKSYEAKRGSRAVCCERGVRA
jgi:hypothetical protein